jgi:hypothetical protein
MDKVGKAGLGRQQIARRGSVKFSATIGRNRLAFVAPLVVSGLALSGCMGSPTYGTDKTASEQLVGDVTGILSLGPKERRSIEYNPRPELVKPSPDAVANLPAPQQSVATSENPAWPESPEQKRARLVANATENRDKPGFRPEIVNDIYDGPASSTPSARNFRAGDSGIVSPVEAEQEAEAFKAKLAETRQGSATSRKYLSEPPLVYRQPSDTAPADELGEDELKKERQRKAAASKGGDWSWKDLIPGV